jgi:hypothetical protein
LSAKLRAGVLHALFLQTGDQKALANAVERYRAAREAWARLIGLTNGKFVDDVTFGPVWYQRGHWRHKLPAIDKDIALLEQAQPEGQKGARPDLIEAALAHSSRPRLQLRHTPPDSFRRGQPLTISVEAAAPIGAVTLRYRHTNQAEPWQTAAMESSAQQTGGGARQATIPAEYSDSPYPLQYYFELRSQNAAAADRPAMVTLFPGFDESWCNQPYFVVRQGTAHMRNTPNLAGGIGAL